MYVTLSVSRCIHYSYPEILDYPRVHGENGYIKIGDERYPIELFDNQDILNQLDIKSMAVLNPNQVLKYFGGFFLVLSEMHFFSHSFNI